MDFEELFSKHNENMMKMFPNMTGNEYNALKVYLYEFWKEGEEYGIKIGKMKYSPAIKIEPDTDIDHTTGYYMSHRD